MPSDREAFVVLPGEGMTMRGPVGGPLTVKASGADTRGSYFLVLLRFKVDAELS